MRSKTFLMFLLVSTLSGSAYAQFDSGSNGSFGPIFAGEGGPFPLVLEVPADGIIHATTVEVQAGFILTFNPNALNTPIYLLATGDVDIVGTIHVNGGNANSFLGGRGGAGGFNGGAAGQVGIPPGAGFGPGAGLPGDGSNSVATGAGAGSFGTRPFSNTNDRDGQIYGSPLLIPPIGGSGGGGTDGVGGASSGGGGGGGALVIASNTEIRLGGQANSYGGTGGAGNGGSGGCVRLVAPKISGGGSVNVYASGFGTEGGNGRIRIDTVDRSLFNISLSPGNVASIGSFMVAIPEVVPRLDVIQAAGQNIPVGSGPVSIQLPFGAPTNQNVVVQGTDFQGLLDIEVVVTPENGTRSVYEAQIDMTQGNPAQVTVPVVLPTNVGVLIHAWTR